MPNNPARRSVTSHNLCFHVAANALEELITFRSQCNSTQCFIPPTQEQFHSKTGRAPRNFLIIFKASFDCLKYHQSFTTTEEGRRKVSHFTGSWTFRCAARDSVEGGALVFGVLVNILAAPGDDPQILPAGATV